MPLRRSQENIVFRPDVAFAPTTTTTTTTTTTETTTTTIEKIWCI